MTESTVLQNTITYCATIMLAKMTESKVPPLAAPQSFWRQGWRMTACTCTVAEMPDRAMQQNTITYTAAIMLARMMGNDSLHLATWLR